VTTARSSHGFRHRHRCALLSSEIGSYANALAGECLRQHESGARRERSSRPRIRQTHSRTECLLILSKRSRRSGSLRRARHRYRDWGVSGAGGPASARLPLGDDCRSRRLLPLAEPARVSKCLAAARADPGPLAADRLGALPANRCRERTGVRLRPEGVAGGSGTARMLCQALRAPCPSASALSLRTRRASGVPCSRHSRSAIREAKVIPAPMLACACGDQRYDGGARRRDTRFDHASSTDLHANPPDRRLNPRFCIPDDRQSTRHGRINALVGRSGSSSLPPLTSAITKTGILAGGHGGQSDFSFGSTGFESSNVSISAAGATVRKRGPRPARRLRSFRLDSLRRQRSAVRRFRPAGEQH
jgi:hypothetical protein